MKLEWQPIESAPKDGTVILVYIPTTDSYRPSNLAGIVLDEGNVDDGIGNTSRR